MNSTKKKARVAGFLYLLVGTSAFNLLYVPSKVIVRGDATATANNILAHETLFRLGNLIGLFYPVAFIFLGLALYRLLSEVNRNHAVLMVIFVLISVAISFANELNNIAALELVRGGDFLPVFGKPQQDALAMMFLNLHGQGIGVLGIFWGLWLFPLGLLVFRSGFFPRVLGVLLIVNGFALLISSLTSLVLPQYEPTVSRWMLLPEFGEIVFMLWLLIEGAKARPSGDSALASA